MLTIQGVMYRCLVVQAAGNAVKRATDALVQAAQQMNNEWTTDETDYSVDLRMVGGLAEVMSPSFLLSLFLSLSLLLLL